MKRIILFVLMLILLVTLSGCSGETDSKYFSYSINPDNSAVITGFTGNMKKVTIPAIIDGHKIVGIDDGVFQSNNVIESVTLPDTISVLGRSAFSYCSALRNVKLPSNLYEIGKSCFMECTALESITFPSSIRIIEDKAFFCCDSLASITWEEGASMKKLGYDAFYACEALTSVTLPHISEFGSQCFYRCKSMTELILPSSIKVIPESFVDSCEALERFEIPNKVTVIEDRAFHNCKALKNLNIPESVTTIGYDSFGLCGLETITIPDTVTELKGNPFGSRDPSEVIISPNHPTLKYKDGVLFCKDNLVWYPKNLNNEVYEVPYGTKMVCKGAFYFIGWEDYIPEKVILPQTVTTIQYASLYGISEVVVPSSVTTIGGSSWESPFDDRMVTLIVKSGSWAYEWAKKNEVKYIIQ